MAASVSDDDDCFVPRYIVLIYVQLFELIMIFKVPLEIALERPVLFSHPPLQREKRLVVS